MTSLSLFAENVGTTLFVAASEAAFTTGLISSIRQNVPAVNPSAVVDAGVTQLRTMFVQPSELAGVLQAYLNGCRIERCSYCVRCLRYRGCTHFRGWRMAFWAAY